MQNRVLKKFLSKIAPPFIGVVYVLAAFELAKLIEDPIYSIALVGLLVLVPLVVWMFYETWQQAKREVEQENEIMMRALKDS